MKTLFLECNMGAAGDMLMSALLELIDDADEFIQSLNEAGIPGVQISSAPSVKNGINGTHITVIVGGAEEESLDQRSPSSAHKDEYGHSHHHEKVSDIYEPHSHGRSHDNKYNETVDASEYQHHGGIHDIDYLINHLKVSDKVKKDALEVYQIIAKAESHVHGVPVNTIHFHEVGTMDAVTDIIGVCMLMEKLAPAQILASPIHVGSGHVRCAHGILPVPAPATAYILKDIPIYGGGIRGELCTPTGAALLKYFVNGFGQMPAMTVSKIGYGMGKKDFEHANCVRAYLGETEESGDEVIELSCNLDDMTPEAIAFAQQLLLEQGALDVYTMPIGMKKGRTGTLLACMCHKELREKMIALIFKHTTTIGMRENVSRRYTLQRTQQEIETEYGPVSVKTASGYGVVKSKPEYEDIARIARENGFSIEDIIKSL